MHSNLEIQDVDLTQVWKQNMQGHLELVLGNYVSRFQLWHHSLWMCMVSNPHVSLLGLVKRVHPSQDLGLKILRIA